MNYRHVEKINCNGQGRVPENIVLDLTDLVHSVILVNSYTRYTYAVNVNERNKKLELFTSIYIYVYIIVGI